MIAAGPVFRKCLCTVNPVVIFLAARCCCGRIIEGAWSREQSLISGESSCRQDDRIKGCRYSGATRRYYNTKRWFLYVEEVVPSRHDAEELPKLNPFEHRDRSTLESCHCRLISKPCPVVPRMLIYFFSVFSLWDFVIVAILTWLFPRRLSKRLSSEHARPRKAGAWSGARVRARASEFST